MKVAAVAPTVAKLAHFRRIFGRFSVKVLFYTYIDGKRQKRGNFGAFLGASMYIVKPIQKNTGGTVAESSPVSVGLHREGLIFIV